MKIEIWSDFICPFCYIGKRRMEMALDQFPQKDNVMIVYKSYELDPISDKNPGMNMQALLAKKYGMSMEKAEEMNANVQQQAKEVGLTYHFDTMKHTNTFDAHRMAQYASKKGKGNELTEALLHAYFTDSKNISDHTTLAGIASNVGLEKGRVLELLESTKYQRYVRDDEEQAKQIGVEGVPFFVFNEKYAVSGAQPVEVFLEVLERVHEEEKENPVIQSLNPHQSETSFCTGEGCEVNRKK